MPGFDESHQAPGGNHIVNLSEALAGQDELVDRYVRAATEVGRLAWGQSAWLDKIAEDRHETRVDPDTLAEAFWTVPDRHGRLARVMREGVFVAAFADGATDEPEAMTGFAAMLSDVSGDQPSVIGQKQRIDKVLGYVPSVLPMPPLSKVYNRIDVNVHPGSRHRGVGQALIATGLEAMPGHRRATFYTDERNNVMRAIGISLGFDANLGNPTGKTDYFGTHYPVRQLRYVSRENTRKTAAKAQAKLTRYKT